MSLYRFNTAVFLLLSLMLAGFATGQEYRQLDSVRDSRFNNKLALLTKPVAEIPHAVINDNTGQANLLKNISSIPEDIYTTGKNFFSTQNIPLLGLMAGSTASIYSQDQRLYLVTHRLHTSSGNFRRFTEYGVAFGDGKWQLAGAAVMGLYGYASNDNRLVKTSFEITEAIVSTGITIQLLKHSIGRESPGSYSKAGGKFPPFPSIHEYSKNQAHYYSFPSGHTATAVTALTVLSENYPDVYWIKPASYCAVACLGASLVSKDMHWYSDLPLAAMIGYSFGKTIAGRSSKETAEENGAVVSPVEVSILPTISYHTKGISLSLAF